MNQLFFYFFIAFMILQTLLMMPLSYLFSQLNSPSYSANFIVPNAQDSLLLWLLLNRPFLNIMSLLLDIWAVRHKHPLGKKKKKTTAAVNKEQKSKTVKRVVLRNTEYSTQSIAMQKLARLTQRHAKLEVVTGV